MGALEDNLDVLNATDESGGEWGRAATRDLVRSRIKIKSLNFMRGRTFVNKCLIIDEAQNLTPKQMKTLVTRAGPGTKVVCLGNIAQIDTPYLTEGSSGLTYVVDRLKDWAHAGHVTLARGERSRLADHAAEVLCKHPVIGGSERQAGTGLFSGGDRQTRSFLLHSQPFPIHGFSQGLPMTLSVRSAAFLLFALIAASRAAQYQPQVGQAGKDVIWVPTPDEVVDRMLTMAQVDAEGLRHGPRRGRRQDRDRGGEEVRRARHRHRVQPGHGEARERQRAAAGVAGNGPGKATIRQADIFADRLQAGDRHHALPAAGAQHEAAADDPRHASGHARRVALLHHGGLGGRRDLDARRPPRLFLGGAGAT